MKSDIEIARSIALTPINDIAREYGIPTDEIENYGRYIAKTPIKLIDEEKVKKNNLILVTAITPTKAGIGKTTVSVGLALGLNRIGKKAFCALREPSLGPCFGMKGGAAGGGYAQVLPMDKINLHFTGDFHAITSAHNMICALLDNYLYQNRDNGFALKEVLWNRVLDINDRGLRYIVTGLGAKTNGITRESSFDITPASEIMAILCLATDEADLRRRIENILLGYTYDDKPFTVKDLGVAGSITVLLRDALSPNLVQTTEHTPAFVHGGPFANIAHGCNSLIATNLGLKLCDYVITEAGFGSDLGAEKFFDIKCRNNLKPSLTIINVTVKALKHNGGCPSDKITFKDLEYLKKGIVNLKAHIDNMKKFNSNILVVLNKYTTDDFEEITYIKDYVQNLNVPFEVSDAYLKGSDGTIDIANKIIEMCENNNNFNFLYDLNDSIEDKIYKICTDIYHSDKISYSEKALKEINKINELGFNHLPICIAKTQYSFSDNKDLLGAPKDFTLTISDVRFSNGAGFVVCLAGDIMTMPGLPKIPVAESIDIDDNGNIIGLF